jgi:uncharacterized protein YjeT (DUF2065 family)
MMRIILRAANEPARRFMLFWNFVAACCAILFLILGAIYLVGGSSATDSHTLDLVQTVERTLQLHGVIQMVVGGLLLYSLHDYRKLTRLSLLIGFSYATWTLVLIVGEALLHRISWGSFAWYGFLMTLLAGTRVFSPPLGDDGRLYTGRPEGSERA